MHQESIRPRQNDFRHWARKRAFSRRERSSLGRIANIIDLHSRLGRGGLVTLFLLAVSPSLPARALKQTMEADKLALRSRQSLRRKQRADTLRAACRHELAERAALFRERSAALRTQHGEAIAGQRTAWRAVAIERDKSWLALRMAFDLPSFEASPAGRLRAQFAAASGRDDAKGKGGADDGNAKGGESAGGKTGKSSAGKTARPPKDPWSQRRSAAQRKADGSYKPRTRGPRRGGPGR